MSKEMYECKLESCPRKYMDANKNDVQGNVLMQISVIFKKMYWIGILTLFNVHNIKIYIGNIL